MSVSQWQKWKNVIFLYFLTFFGCFWVFLYVLGIFCVLPALSLPVGLWCNAYGLAGFDRGVLERDGCTPVILDLPKTNPWRSFCCLSWTCVCVGGLDSWICFMWWPDVHDGPQVSIPYDWFNGIFCSWSHVNFKQLHIVASISFQFHISICVPTHIFLESPSPCCELKRRCGESAFFSWHLFHRQVATRAQNLADEAVSHGVTSMPKLRESDVHLSPVNEVPIRKKLGGWWWWSGKVKHR